jgi:hypothetical protein
MDYYEPQPHQDFDIVAVHLGTNASVSGMNCASKRTALLSDYIS